MLFDNLCIHLVSDSEYKHNFNFRYAFVIVLMLISQFLACVCKNIHILKVKYASDVILRLYSHVSGYVLRNHLLFKQTLLQHLLTSCLASKTPATRVHLSQVLILSNLKLKSVSMVCILC